MALRGQHPAPLQGVSEARRARKRGAATGKRAHNQGKAAQQRLREAVERARRATDPLDGAQRKKRGRPAPAAGLVLPRPAARVKLDSACARFLGSGLPGMRQSTFVHPGQQRIHV